MLNGPQSLKLQRIGKRLVNVENTVAKLLEILHCHMATVAPLESVLLEDLRKMRAEFEERKRIGIRKKKT